MSPGTAEPIAPGASRPRDAADRAASGLAARRRAPLESHAGFAPSGREDPIKTLAAQDTDRLSDLVPIRYQRMVASPLAFLRGSAAVMTADLAGTPVSGLSSQLCGDAHLLNFGMFASPERRLVFDINDFDETAPGPWEWDVKRLVASLAVAGRENGLGRKARTAVVVATARRYRTAMAWFAGQGELDVWYAHADIDELRETLADQLGRARSKKIGKMTEKARSRDSLQAFHKLTAVVDGQRRIVSDPPLIVPVGDMLSDAAERDDLEQRLRGVLAEYRRTLAFERRHLFDAFAFVDMARKVVGVGSVGTRCWIVLMTGRDDQDPLFLQVKEAGTPVVARHLPPSWPQPGGQGRRVVEGQRLMQATGDIFLGWATVEGRDFYVRQLRDWKGAITVEEMDEKGLRAYGELCGWTLARAHARTGDRIAIAAYLGDGAEFDHAVAEFAERYADQTESDHAAMVAAKQL
ncbi:DUF2252 domain-containing protein [Actinoplanes sp. TBRC 11911]|uniref:DUF2252 domain-containing protein n=1 Tax=Actinoplanes sp. TBRC 11911 TaxID=2729386 RepID=UPI00145DEE5C|nr:DUF2252 domain-containing protein [Actinoplanes sp. TBRC 11911]NMO52259.1 DUF2252 domain-containing protein [Actinoplanes sp. TBRC 11911]